MSCTATWEDLVRLADGEADAALAEHAACCPDCAERLAVLAGADRALAGLPRPAPRAEALLAAREALDREIRGDADLPDVMTLEEVAAFLRIRPEELDVAAEDLPAFVVAGRVRVRREKLLAWMEERETTYERERTHSLVAWASRARYGGGVA